MFKPPVILILKADPALPPDRFPMIWSEQAVMRGRHEEAGFIPDYDALEVYKPGLAECIHSAIYEGYETSGSVSCDDGTEANASHSIEWKLEGFIHWGDEMKRKVSVYTGPVPVREIAARMEAAGAEIVCIGTEHIHIMLAESGDGWGICESLNALEHAMGDVVLDAKVIWGDEMNTRTVGNSDPMAKLFAEHRKVLAQRSELMAALSVMLGAAEVDCMDDESNVWRSAMIYARAALAKVTKWHLPMSSNGTGKKRKLTLKTQMQS
jgi:hypothetical protein